MVLLLPRPRCELRWKRRLRSTAGSRSVMANVLIVRRLSPGLPPAWPPTRVEEEEGAPPLGVVPPRPAKAPAWRCAGRRHATADSSGVSSCTVIVTTGSDLPDRGMSNASESDTRGLVSDTLRSGRGSDGGEQRLPPVDLVEGLAELRGGDGGLG